MPIKSFQVTVGDAKQRKTTGRRSLFDAFGGVFNNNAQPQEYIDIKADAFFAITTNKKTVYRGEPFTITMAFYEAVSNKAPLNFPRDLGQQVGDISRKLNLLIAGKKTVIFQALVPNLLPLIIKIIVNLLFIKARFFHLQMKILILYKLA